MKMKRYVILLMLMSIVMLFSTAKKCDCRFKSAMSDRFGLPLDDGTYKVTFKFYDSAKKGTCLGDETKLLKCENGICDADLKTLEDLSEKGYKEIWISVKTDDIPESDFRVKRYLNKNE